MTVQPSVDRRDGYELILGSSIDPQFGPVLLFGTGGELVEVFRDRALALAAAQHDAGPPGHGARRASRARSPASAGARRSTSTPWPRCWFASAISSSSNPRIREIDVNPLLASARGLLALDARVVLADADVADAALPRPAIRPYPTEYVGDGRAARRNADDRSGRSDPRTSR